MPASASNPDERARQASFGDARDPHIPGEKEVRQNRDIGREIRWTRSFPRTGGGLYAREKVNVWWPRGQYGERGESGHLSAGARGAPCRLRNCCD